MLPDNFKDDVLEIIGIAKQCPDSLQAKCLEMLLDHYLQSAPGQSKKPKASDTVQTPPPAEKESDGDDQTGNNGGGGGGDEKSQRDLVMADLHLKARKFLEKYGRTVDDLNQIFFKDGDTIGSLYDDLKTTKASETQIRIGLLSALRSAIHDGEFTFSGEEVREECQLRKAYDQTNFSVNFKNNASLFEGFEKYEKTSPTIRLSEVGKKRLADLIVELK